MDLDRLSKYFIINLALIVIGGIIMVYSSSYIYAQEIYGSSAHYFVRQLLFVALGGAFAFVVSKTKFTFWIKYADKINIAATLILLLTFIPGIGIEAKGAHRWINLGFMQFQPGEILKYTLLISSLVFFENLNEMSRNKKIYHGLSILVPLLFLLIQPDFGAFTICFIVMLYVAFLSSLSRKIFYSTLFIGIALSTIILFAKPYRVQRILTFMDPWKNPKTTGFQIIQSYLAFANGSFFGNGIGNSKEKLFYLPEAHNDFIFSVLGEELGFIGVFFTIFLYAALLFIGIKIAIKVANRIGTIVCSSIIFAIALQAILNMGVVLGLLPTKGLNLPFFSYGGSSLVTNFLGVGILFSVVNFYKNLNQGSTSSFSSPPESDYRFQAPPRGRLP